MTSPRDAARLRHGVNSLTAGSLRPRRARASSTSSHVQPAQMPASALQPYNPQEWVPSSAPIADRSRQFVVDAGQDSAPPPPPYSPPRTRQQRPTSTFFDHTSAPSSTPPFPPRMALSSPHVASPEPLGNLSFPPPPPLPPPQGVRTRRGSRDFRFGLPTLPSLSWQTEQEQPFTGPPDAPAVALHLGRRTGPSTLNHGPERTVAPDLGGNVSSRPPAARRAASTGAIDALASQRSRSMSQTRWEPGMPLPPPPPGPPPSSSRSRSVQSIDRISVPIISPPTRRPPPSGVASLGPVPPTPADWFENDAESSQPGEAERGHAPGVFVDTTAAANASDLTEPLGSSNSAGSLSRARAVRHDKTIVQRRAESRNRHTSDSSTEAAAETHNISNIVVPTSGHGLARRLAVNRLTPRSVGRREMEQQRTGDSLLFDSRNSTPRAFSSSQLEAAETLAFSPYQGRTLQTPASAPVEAPKSLSISPLHIRSASGFRVRGSSRPPVAAWTPISKQIAVAQTGDEFAASAVDRFQAFAASESRAASDAERVRMFANFIVNESRIRRERYSSAMGAMGSEIFDLIRDLFRPMTVPDSRSEPEAPQETYTPASADTPASLREPANPVTREEGQATSAPASAHLPASPSGVRSQLSNTNWTNNYMPCLSPILSMSVSDNHENGSSRGRPSSRWWETDSQSESGMLGRSKREVKYMGVSRDQWFEEEQGATGTTAAASTDVAGTSDPDPAFEYPTEKAEWPNQEDSSAATPKQFKLSGGAPSGSSSSPSIQNKQEGLDVSRLVTLPPPYPRHHPAVNNNHPQLTAIRSSVRSLNDLSELNKVKEKFAKESSERREELFKAACERRQGLMTNLQKEISSGNIGYADAAVIETDSQDQEKDEEKELEKEEYERFQNEVVLPLNDVLTGRITVATDLFEDLARHLFDNGQLDADMPQEEGDDRPELLEKLTLFKWIFETRESLHRAIYDILSERNKRYSEVVMTPYQLSGNHEKLKAAEAFFAKDATKRQEAFSNEVLGRAHEFLSVLEEAVERGVALQLSAFWDIAPQLRRLLDSIPCQLNGFNIRIPASEFDENPAYHDHPLQYLHSILTHTEKSTYQFIESHTNLLCLRHEVKGAVVKAKTRVLETQLTEDDGTPISAEERTQRAQLMQQAEDEQLTEDLKEKVRLVQEQWSSALGEAIRSVKMRTEEWLMSTGGWDETLEEGVEFPGVAI